MKQSINRHMEPKNSIMKTKSLMKPIGYVKNSRYKPTDDFWGSVVSEIELTDEIPSEALMGIEEFSHLEIFFFFDKADDKNISFTGHPRNNHDLPLTGIFATRKKDRPNHIGHTIVNLIKREKRKLFVEKLDAINGTPILDIKPVMKEFLPSEEIKQPVWTKEVMKNYWKK